MTLSPGFISLCDPLHLSAGRTCDLFLPTDYVKGNVMSLLRLHYVSLIFHVQQLLRQDKSLKKQRKGR